MLGVVVSQPLRSHKLEATVVHRLRLGSHLCTLLYLFRQSDGDPTDPILVNGVCWCPSCNGLARRNFSFSVPKTDMLNADVELA